MSHKIKDGAIFVADAHYNKYRKEFENFLELIVSKKLNPSQLFLMGDIFDFITGECRYFIKQNIAIVEKLNKISQDIEIFYLEGNHDYNLKQLFPNIKVVKREEQPIFMQYEDKKIALAHGDIFTPRGYDIYCIVIRNAPLLKFLNMIDFNFWLSKKIENALDKKSICHKNNNFEDIAKRRVENYKEDIVIEGHFHQGGKYNIANQKYINIPSLYCQKEFIVFENGEFVNILL